MHLKRLELFGFKSFAKPTKLEFAAPVSAVVGPNGSGKSNVAEAIRWVLGEQSIKSLRGKKGEDLIFNGSQTAPRLGRASVSLFFDNSRNFFPLDYEEVKITRKVFRDGANEYLINDSQMRHKDIVELLSKVGMGTSSHNIISQGESDKVLNASPRDRRQMIEDALGLKIYQLKKAEAERKLAKTEENMAQVESLKKEIQPHLRFLKKQVDRANEVLEVKDKLRAGYLKYFANEIFYLQSAQKQITEKKENTKKKASEIKKELLGIAEDSALAGFKKEIEGSEEKIRKESDKVSELRARRNSIERDLGRLEGMVEVVESTGDDPGSGAFSAKEVSEFADYISREIEMCLGSDNISDIKPVLSRVREHIKNFLSKSGTFSRSSSSDLGDLRAKHKNTKDSLEAIKKKETEMEEELDSMRRNLAEKESMLRGMEKEKYEMEIKLKELNGILQNLSTKEEGLKIQKDDLDREMQEAKILVGEISSRAAAPVDAPEWEGERAKARREIERMKIRVEDSGMVGEDVINEYEDVKKRNEFFEKELADLENSIKSLKELLRDLEGKIDRDFKEGIGKINGEFQVFFEAMFGGGRAELRIVVPKKRAKKEEDLKTEEELELEEEKQEEGIEIYVNLPQKRIHSLDMLSGGERALTSIALLFAMTQVNPPPFLVLDETDAALDEANSKKYGSMLKELSQNTQLIVITHNRETMKQAGILYGVTMGSDSISKLLSIKFTEAEKYSSTG